MKYSWKAKSDDGAFEDKGHRWFDSKREAYEDMREYAFEKMMWNTEWEDVDENNSIGYDMHLSRNKIVHTSYSGTYTYEIVEKKEQVVVYDNTWTVEDEFAPKDDKDWKVASFDGVGDLWMNNCDGYMVLILPNGTILKSDI